MLRWFLWLVFLPLTLPFKVVRWLVWSLGSRETLEIVLRGSVPDVSMESRFMAGATTPLLTLLGALASAEVDPKVRRLLVKVEGFRGGLARAEELRLAFGRLHKAGKDVIVHADHLDLAGYWLALGATRIHLSPTGSLDVVGVASEFTLWKGLLDKAGIRARLAARGKYKSMREAFTEDRLSDANREMLESLVGDLYRQLEERIASGRSIARTEVRGILDRGPFHAGDAERLGLVDAAKYDDELREELKVDAAAKKLTPARYLARRQRHWFPQRLPRVAFLHVQGSIQLEAAGMSALQSQSTSARTFLRACDRVRKDKSIRALLLRVNSPGGSALASDLMWHALEKAMQGRPLFVSMGNVAASGGYYVSGVKGARIFASPCTVTGSIGVVGGKVEVSGLYERLGVAKHVIRVGRHATFHSPSVDFSDEELEKLQRDIDELYADFVAKMARGRGLDAAALEAAAQGRVWTGAQALAQRLVDELGGLREAMDALRRQLGLPERKPLGLVVLDHPGFFERVRRARGGAEARAMTELVPEDIRSLLTWGTSHERLLFRMPFDVTPR